MGFQKLTLFLISWPIDPLLRNDSEISNYATAVTK
jgi:hypothetical protein